MTALSASTDRFAVEMTASINHLAAQDPTPALTAFAAESHNALVELSKGVHDIATTPPIQPAEVASMIPGPLGALAAAVVTAGGLYLKTRTDTASAVAKLNASRDAAHAQGRWSQGPYQSGSERS